MTRHVPWRLLGLSVLMGVSALGQDADPWADYEKVDSILVVPEDDDGPRKKIRIRLIDPLPLTGSGQGGDVIHGLVTINGTIRQPHHAMNQPPAEAGAAKPATAPIPKSEGGDKAQPESEGPSR